MDLNDMRVIIAEMKKDVDFIKETVQRLEESLLDIKERYVTKEEFTPVKNIVFTIGGSILLTVLGAIVKTVLIN